MERNIDRNLRMAKREARRFFGIRHRRPMGVVIFISLFTALIGYVLIEPHLKGLFFNDGFVVLAIFALTLLLFWLAARLLGFDLWDTKRGPGGRRRPY